MKETGDGPPLAETGQTGGVATDGAQESPRRDTGGAEGVAKPSYRKRRRRRRPSGPSKDSVCRDVPAAHRSDKNQPHDPELSRQTSRHTKHDRDRRDGAEADKLGSDQRTPIENRDTTGNGSRPEDRSQSADGGKNPSGANRRKRGNGKRQLYAALDLGTNNCRLLVAEPQERGFRVVDAFSRIVRLGEGVSKTGELSGPAMDRAIDALKVCRKKLSDRGVARVRLIATEACRAAENGTNFLDRVQSETGLELEIVSRQTEARLAVAGCSTLVDRHAKGVVLFDIGGGSSELVWLDLRGRSHERGVALTRFIRSWTSMPLGVVTLSERHGGGIHVPGDVFEAMVADVNGHLDSFAEADLLAEIIAEGGVHMLGTSGTVTTLAGVHLGLARYDRRRVDGIWLEQDEIGAMIGKLAGMTYEERVANPCIGADRADLVVAGCAILEAIHRRWPCSRLRVADRGLREGILVELMAADGVWRRRRRRGNMSSKRRRKPQ